MSDKSKNDLKHRQTDLKLTYEEYKKLRSVPMEELSEEDQELRLHDFNNRLNIGMKYIRGMIQGYIPQSVTDAFPDDDPLKGETEMMRIIINNRHNKAEA